MPIVKIGDTLEDGVVFHVDATGEHGLVIAKERIQGEKSFNDKEGFFDWPDANRQCASLGEGWRLPTIEALELLTGVWQSIGVKTGLYWSSSEDESWPRIKRQVMQFSSDLDGGINFRKTTKLTTAFGHAQAVKSF